MSEESIAFDSVLNVCQHQHRRIVLGALAEQRRSLTPADLTEAILEYNHQTQPTDASEDVVTDIRRSLYHVHLPMLAAEGFITYGSEQEFVEPTEQLHQVKKTLSTILDADSSVDAPIELEG
jgi:hypothetical protein